MSKPPKLWATCIDASGTKSLKEGEKYLIQPVGGKAKVIIWQGNRHHVLGNIVNKNRFKTITT